MFSFEFSQADIHAICRVIGVMGSCIYITGFFLLCSGRISNTTPIYFAMNIAAASFVLISLSVDFNLSSAFIQVFYITMSVLAVIRIRRQAV